MNILTIITLAVILAAMIYGYWRGFLRMIFSLLSFVLLIVLISWATPYISGFLVDHTGIHASLQQVCTDKIRDSVPLNSAGTGPADPELAVAQTGLPGVLQQQFLTQTGNALENLNFFDNAGSYVADWVIKGAAFLIALLLAHFLLRFLVGVLDIFAKLPVVRGINHLLGLLLGALMGCILVCLVLFLAVVLRPSDVGQQILTQIQDSPILSFLYNNNVILLLLKG